MKTFPTLAVGLLSLLLLQLAGAETAEAEESAAEGGPVQRWLAQESATGGWGGWRSRIAEAGVTPSLNYTTDLMTNPVGGLDQDAAYAAGFYGSLELDFGILAGISGLSLYAAGAWDQGRDLSGDDIGNVFGVSQIFNGDGFRLAELYLQQTLWDGAVSLAAGRLAAGDLFAAADSYAYYVSGAVNGNPTSILVNAPSFTTPPYAQWGARAKVAPGAGLSLSAGVYNADPEVQADAKHGVDFRLNPQDGVLTLAEVGYDPALGQEGLAGHYALGGYYDSSLYDYVDGSGRSKTGNYGLYLIAEQAVFRESDSDDQGLTLWATVTMNPDREVNTLPYAAYGGLIYQGLLPGREQDATALALYYGGFSDDLPDQSYELVLEANHRFQLGPWLYLTPDFQYVFNPDGGGIPDAAVFGMEISVDF